MSNWFPKAQHGSVIGYLSISFLAGDAVARYVTRTFSECCVYGGRLSVVVAGWGTC